MHRMRNLLYSQIKVPVKIHLYMKREKKGVHVYVDLYLRFYRK